MRWSQIVNDLYSYIGMRGGLLEDAQSCLDSATNFGLSPKYFSLYSLLFSIGQCGCNWY